MRIRIGKIMLDQFHSHFYIYLDKKPVWKTILRGEIKYLYFNLRIPYWFKTI